MSQQYQRLTVHLGDKQHFDLYRTGLFVVTRIEGEAHENRFGVIVRKRAVLARGRMVSGDTLRVTRGPMSLKQLRDLLHKAGYSHLKLAAKTPQRR